VIARTFIFLTALGLVMQVPDYRADIEQFRARRAEEIGGPTGWAALAGLHWLTDGTHTVGRGSDNDIVLAAPSSPARLGTVTVDGANVTIALAAGVRASVKGKTVASVDLSPGTDAADGLTIGGMTIVTIRRGQRTALRVWDTKSPTRVHFTGLKWMPIDPAWRIDARWVPHDPAPKVHIVNVLGEMVEMPNVGYAEFTVGGQTFRLEALLESDDAPELFFMFRDATSGHTTYVAGRYLYTDLPKDGRVTLDFNKAKNPPCAFTDYATCPLPPPRNRLPIAVLAGELDDGHHQS
jgi:uncharacterized protein (DUF1684 family)